MTADCRRSTRAGTEPPLEVEPGDLGEYNADVGPTMEDSPHRVADLRGRQCAGGNLVGQRLEQMEVAPVDQRDLDWHSREPQGGLKASEATADHDHSMGLLCCDHDWQSGTGLLTIASSS